MYIGYIWGAGARPTMVRSAPGPLMDALAHPFMIALEPS
jgi:hypothetical protein